MRATRGDPAPSSGRSADAYRAAAIFRSYFFPSERAGFEAQAFYWVRTSELASGLDAHLGDTVRAWLASPAWPWQKVAFPGRDIAWADWAALPPA